ncbi:Lar family restriction alleviation protein [Andreprevotia lacus]|nr:Lar family restriction alleviation protein [Andreprevotia lacus]
MTTPTPAPTPMKPCKKCGAPGEHGRSGSKRFWVQCGKFGRNGNCNQISQQADSKKEALALWNAMNT